MSAVTVALDAMGGDRAPVEMCAGAAQAAVAGELEVVLVGDEAAIRSAFAGPPPAGVSIRHAAGMITADADPAAAVRNTPDASIVRTAAAVREGWAHAAVSAGPTGAMLAASLVAMRRVPGVNRPGLAAVLPAATGPLTLIDAGANSDCRPEMLVQFAYMGACFADGVLGIREPRVGLLTIGEEPGKGNQLAREAYELLAGRSDLRFYGNVEGRDLLTGGIDVVVTDGFTGNVALKTAEGTAREVLGLVRRAATGTTRARIGGLLLAGALRGVRTRMNPETYGGAFLLGLAAISVVAHGASSRVAIANACRMAAQGHRHDVCGQVAARLAAASTGRTDRASAEGLC